MDYLVLAIEGADVINLLSEPSQLLDVQDKASYKKRSVEAMGMINLPGKQAFCPGKRKFLLPLLLNALIVLSTLSIAIAGNQIQWRDVTSGMAEGKRINKYVLADVYTSWCGWCKRLDEDTFKDQDLVRFLNDKFVCIKANAEDHSAGQQLARQYSVNGYPCALVFDRSGKLVDRIVGYKNAQDYEATLENIVNNNR